MSNQPNTQPGHEHEPRAQRELRPTSFRPQKKQEFDERPGHAHQHEASEIEGQERKPSLRLFSHGASTVNVHPVETKMMLSTPGGRALLPCLQRRTSVTL
jgi:hypothetical protein